MTDFAAARRAALSITLATSLLAAHSVRASDFDGDGRDDLLIRHLHTDTWRYYTLVDDVPAEQELDLETDPSWRFVATGDFDGNGYDDVLLRRIDTLESAYHAVTADGVEARVIAVTRNPLYDIVGAGDFDGDGKDEILIRRNRDFGAWLYYDVDGARVISRQRFGPSENLDFVFAGIGDLNGDGRDDILLRHRDVGNWIYYEMNGTTRALLRRPSVTQNLAFAIEALADINFDGQADPLLRAYDLLVSTDVLAEGVNLQQCRNIINFDMPWNPMRLVQRHGRIDRISSPHDRVFLRTFFPTDRLDRLLDLKKCILDKLALAAASVGVVSPIEGGHRTRAHEHRLPDPVFARWADGPHALPDPCALVPSAAGAPGGRCGAHPDALRR